MTLVMILSWLTIIEMFFFSRIDFEASVILPVRIALQSFNRSKTLPAVEFLPGLLPIISSFITLPNSIFNMRNPFASSKEDDIINPSLVGIAAFIDIVFTQIPAVYSNQRNSEIMRSKLPIPCAV